MCSSTYQNNGQGSPSKVSCENTNQQFHTRLFIKGESHMPCSSKRQRSIAIDIRSVSVTKYSTSFSYLSNTLSRHLKVRLYAHHIARMFATAGLLGSTEEERDGSTNFPGHSGKESSPCGNCYQQSGVPALRTGTNSKLGPEASLSMHHAPEVMTASYFVISETNIIAHVGR